MKILHTVEYYSPSVGGAQEVVRQISERLVEYGHQVTVATTKLKERTSKVINGVNIEEFEISGNEVNGYKGDIARYQQFLLENDFDVMMNYAAQQWATDLVFPLLDRIRYQKILAPCGFSGLFNPQYKAYFQKMPEVLKYYNNLIFHSANYRDIQFAQNLGMRNFTVIPNGASEEEFQHIDNTFRKRYGISANIPMILTVGSHTGLKGHHLAIESFRRARIGRSVLVIVGNPVSGGGCLADCQKQARMTSLTSLGLKKVLIIDPPRQDVVAAYHASDLFIFCSKIECSPIVLFEAMASKTPFITVAAGNAEEIISWGQGGILLPTIQLSAGMVDADPKAIAHILEDLLKNPDYLNRLGEEGQKAWQKRFSWGKIAREYERLYLSIVNNKTHAK
jgi:L-malate glycosyltransferase